MPLTVIDLVAVPCEFVTVMVAVPLLPAARLLTVQEVVVGDASVFVPENAHPNVIAERPVLNGYKGRLPPAKIG